jgi:4,4'-diaponeurosporenoate glycosyltransferase
VPVVDWFLALARLGAGCWLLWSVRRPGAAEPSRPPVAVVVPARDEADSLPRLLASLADEVRDGDELLVVDDHSSDATAAVARDGGATVLAAPDLPPGWTGKAWALHTGIAATASPVLVLLDADVVVEPGGLDRVVGEAQRRGGLVSVEPDHVPERPYERLSALLNVVSMMGTGACTPRATDRPAGAFGPCLVTSRADHAAAGGHAAVAAEILDDVVLARRYVEAGLPVHLLGGRGAVRFRMYPGGLRQLVEGWSKNIAAGAGSTPLGTLVLTIAWVSVLLQAPWWLATAGVAGVVVYALCAAQLAWMFRRVGRFGWWPVVAFPVPLAAFLVVFARSLVLTVVRRRVRWRGRDVSLRRRAP